MEDAINFSWLDPYFEFEVDMVPVSTQVCVVEEPEFRLKGFRIKMANASKETKSPYIGLMPGPEVPDVICKEYDIPSNLYQRGLNSGSIFFDDEGITGIRFEWNGYTDETNKPDNLSTLIGYDMNAATGQQYNFESVNFTEDNVFFGFFGI